ncbi:Dachshund-like protein [Dinothrombium tinctorium]|uniref:Dachshund-like protein n=1 Tax=Dinothrombium tinctorium TaxID=1965070 RepID=A0A3S3PJA2_9ACAR|nr:Dachshund-like protein [Dinothrombium tinctorium]
MSSPVSIRPQATSIPATAHYRSSISPTSTCSDEDSSHSQPNDLTLHTTSSRSKHTTTFPNYPSFYSPPHHLGQGHSPAASSPYIATNECRIIEYRGARIAAFLSANKNPCEYLLCLPQAFELFLKHLVGGLHTVYTKLKRLDIVPIVCNVEQVRILRGLGAIQPGVNRCKLLATKDFDSLYKDCTTAR